MGRRSDHSREELEALIVAEGHRLLAETGYARFSAREVAKRIGYSIGTIYNVFADLDRLMMAINGRTFVLWAAFLRSATGSRLWSTAISGSRRKTGTFGWRSTTTASRRASRRRKAMPRGAGR